MVTEQSILDSFFIQSRRLWHEPSMLLVIDALEELTDELLLERIRYTTPDPGVCAHRVGAPEIARRTGCTVQRSAKLLRILKCSYTMYDLEPEEGETLMPMAHS